MSQLSKRMEDEEAVFDVNEKFFHDIDVKGEVELTDKSTQTYSHESLLAIRNALSRKRLVDSPQLMRDDIAAKASKSKSPTAVSFPPVVSAGEPVRSSHLADLCLNEQLKYFRSSITSSHSDLMNNLERKVHDFLQDMVSDYPNLAGGHSATEQCSKKDLGGKIKVYTKHPMLKFHLDPKDFVTVRDNSTQTSRPPNYMNPLLRNKVLI